MQGLKTGMYYLRTKPAANAIQFSIDKSKMKKAKETNGVANDEASVCKDIGSAFNMNAMACSLDNKDDCVMCGS